MIVQSNKQASSNNIVPAVHLKVAYYFPCLLPLPMASCSWLYSIESWCYGSPSPSFDFNVFSLNWLRSLCHSWPYPIKFIFRFTMIFQAFCLSRSFPKSYIRSSTDPEYPRYSSIWPHLISVHPLFIISRHYPWFSALCGIRDMIEDNSSSTVILISDLFWHLYFSRSPSLASRYCHW